MDGFQENLCCQSKPPLTRETCSCTCCQTQVKASSGRRYCLTSPRAKVCTSPTGSPCASPKTQVLCPQKTLMSHFRHWCVDVQVRSLFLEGRGINSSVAIHQDYSGNTRERAFAHGVAIGSGYLYETTFQKEVWSDLTGERGTLMGAIQGLFMAQYEVLREKGHSPSEAFNETVEEATQSLYPLVAKNGMDWMYANCSTTAQRGALDWYPEFYKATKPVFQALYESVERGDETRRSLTRNSMPTYKEDLEVELDVLRESEMWRAGVEVRKLRPENN
eukprot:m.3107 g.3107  ORF g.3107 m.3107 type:complete len:276 (-) comp2020_c0_seq2:199-1026(-)